jgi:hypothetical protein
LRKAEVEEAEDRKNATAKKLRVATSSAARRGMASRKTNARAVLLAGRGSARKPGKQAVTRLASDSSGRTKSSRHAREL